jgi:hypothetical protein
MSVLNQWHPSPLLDVPVVAVVVVVAKTAVVVAVHRHLL